MDILGLGLLLVVWTLGSFAVGLIAHERGYGLLLWTLVSLIFSPLAAYMYLVAIPAPVEVKRQTRIIELLDRINRSNNTP